MTAVPALATGRPRIDIRPLVRAALLSGLVLFGGLGGWAAIMPISGAVIASGHVRVPGKPQPVQSVDGGTVAHVAVQNGATVRPGDLLMTLDATLPAAQLDIAMGQLAQALATRARLEAEASGAAAPDFTPPPLPFPAPDMAAAAADQTVLFTARALRMADARARASAADRQLAAQIDGIAAQTTAAAEEQALLAAEMAKQEDLVAQGLARQAPLADLKRQDAALRGRLAAHEADRARLAAARGEAALAQAEAEGTRAEEVAQGLSDSAAAIAELTQQIVTMRAALARTELRAPVAGVVHELAVPTAGAVVAPGDVLARIVPQDRGIEIEVAVDPRAIDQVHPGQTAKVVISAFSPQSVPKLDATVTEVPPDASTDPATGRSFYRVVLHLPDSEIARIGAPLTPGMPADAYLATGDRPALAWLMAPLLSPMRAALREE